MTGQVERVTMQRTKPPFRADHVGSLLRSAALKDARAKREKNEITAEQLKAVEDREIEAIIKKQEAVGLKSITDGEYRRAFWNYDFLGKLDGVEAYLGERKIKFQGKQPKPMMLRVIGKLGSFSGHPMIEHFKFVAGAHQADAEDDDPVAVVAALPLRPLGGAGGDLSGHGGFLPRSRPELPQGGARLRRRRLPLHPARRGELHLSLRSGAAPAGHRARRRSEQAAARSTPT